MQNKTVKLFALGALAAATTFGASAENTYDYFVGFDAGVHLNSEIEAMGLAAKLDRSEILGMSGGVTINDHHRIKMGLAYNPLEIDVEDGKEDRVDLKVSYDYLVPISEKLSWTVGGHVGYETFEDYDDGDSNEMNGFIYGLQTGLDYRFAKNWSVGGEIGRTFHHAERADESDALYVQIVDDYTVMTNIQYHF
ncbi:outer membrane beta-barrel protein [Vibrio hepatarius]|uniref:outer membrane beta-barrel protein n=1 Tax=Vibrio hepatarius TaxID=171383 RepID=UPI001C09E358|nr:outer membrane beta-barrel protein [Vibrio hepatarius]MBU2895524.1 porin family protein [Vibrio hepatarius]